MSQDETAPARGKRERSPRYPGVPLSETIELCRFVEGRGLDGLTAADIATALGYKNIKTNTFSAKLSAARQFGLLVLKDEGYSLTPLARSILHPVDPAELPRLHRQALLEPQLYSDLASQFGDKRLPEASILGNVLYHNYQIIASSKQQAAEAFLESARFAGALGDDHVFRPSGAPATLAIGPPDPAAVNGHSSAGRALADAPPSLPTSASNTTQNPTPSEPRPNDVRIDLRLWGADAGKAIRVRAPEVITPESFERLIQTLRLHLRIEEPAGVDEAED